MFSRNKLLFRTLSRLTTANRNLETQTESNQHKYTHFGFQKVREDEKAQKGVII